MRIFQNKSFKKWATEEGLSDSDFLATIDEMERGLTGDNLGGNIYKKRMGVAERGKSGGVRTIIAYKSENKAFFLVGYAKNEQANISNADEKALKMAAKELLKYSDKEIETAIKAGALIEIEKPKKDKNTKNAESTEKPSEVAEKKTNGKQNPKKHT